MGGSGGFFSGQINPGEILQKLRDSQNETEKQVFETEVAEVIDEMLPSSQRNVEAIQKHLKEIKDSLSSDIDGTVDSIFGGSVAKHTYVDGLSDIDTLVVLNNTELRDLPPTKVLDYFLSRLSGRFPKTVIERGKLTVTLKFDDAEIQLLPAIKMKTGVKIPEQDGRNWVFIKPYKFQEALRKVNDRNNSRVLPIIRLAKSITATFPENRRLSGYHIEALAVQIFRNYRNDASQKEMLKDFFERASSRVLRAMPDVTGQSGDLTSYLGKAGSLNRKLVSDSLGNMARRMENADLACSITQWKEILTGL